MNHHDLSTPVALLLSGGVDSSTALFRLKDAGYSNVTAFYLKIWLEDELSYLGSCPWEEDLSYAAEVCRMAGVRLEIVPLQREYFDRVVHYTIGELKAGRTPSPDIMCNSRIKFDAFLKKVRQSFDLVATGHYARTERNGDTTVLLRAPDPVKDQSYFLSHLTQDQVSRLLFPVGDLLKTDVRLLAERWNLPNRNRKDSQGICFLGKLRYPDFVRHYLGERPGKIVEKETGRLLGNHAGYWFHTIGQRQGLGLSGGPWYVSGKDVEENIVYVSGKEAVVSDMKKTLTARDTNWIAHPPSKTRLLVKLRHGPRLTACTALRLPEGRMRLELDEGDAGIAAGQFAVLYDGEICLGCGTIE